MRTVELNVDEGRVNCPLNGDTDLDRCFTCGRLVDYQVDSGGATVTCTGERPLRASQYARLFL